MKAEPIREMEKHTTYKKENVREHFDQLAPNYDAVQQAAGYPDPDQIADVVDQLQADIGGKKSYVEIIDFGCGTGLVGQALRNAGYECLTGIDCSNGMLYEAQQKKVYTDLQFLNLGSDNYIESFPNQLKGKFDFVTAVTTSGLIENGVPDENIFEQMLFSLKKHGYLVFTAQHSFLGEFWYAKKLEELVKAGRMQLTETKLFSKYGNLHQGPGKFTKTPARVWAYQKCEEDSVLVSSRLKRKSTMSISENSDGF